MRNIFRSLPCSPLASAWLEHSIDSALRAFVVVVAFGAAFAAAGGVRRGLGKRRRCHAKQCGQAGGHSPFRHFRRSFKRCRQLTLRWANKRGASRNGDTPRFLKRRSETGRRVKISERRKWPAIVTCRPMTGDTHTPDLGQALVTRWSELLHKLSHAGLSQFKPGPERQASPWFIRRSQNTPTPVSERLPDSGPRQAFWKAE